ncbi:MAG: hypothetical protein KBI32_06970 [Phycisphaerae bacterium]|nr:hypothetical protein [Phycisphaerae bacterium]HON91172.1 BRO family protein [Sedimentisphaerales bacterium]
MIEEERPSAPNGVSLFERIRRTNAAGAEYWSSRDFAQVLGYADYHNFEQVMKRAKTACFNSGQRIEDHFVEITEMILDGARSQSQSTTVLLSRYACYLIIRNAHRSSKFVVLGQIYFSIQTQWQEPTDEMTEEERQRLFRKDMMLQNIRLASAAGVVEAKDYAIFQDHGYEGLYGKRRVRTSRFKDGWLVVVIYFAVFSWSRCISLGGFALFYRRRIRRNGNYEAESIPWCMDCYHFLLAGAAIVVFCLLDPQLPPWARALIWSLSSFRIVDILVDCTMLAVFGNRYGRSWQGAMIPRRLQRTLIVDLMILMEIVFWNACWVFVAGTADSSLYLAPVERPAQALHVSMATVTTIGYGTYAPVQMRSIVAAFVQAVSALLLLSGVIGGVFSRNSSTMPGSSRPAIHESYYDDDYGLPVIWDQGIVWGLRWLTPWVIPPIVVAVLSWYRH